MTITAGTTVQFTRWQALGWTAPPAPFKVVDTRGEGDHLEIFDGERWGPAKHYELVDTPAGDPEPDYGRIAAGAWYMNGTRDWDAMHDSVTDQWRGVAAAVIAAYRAAHPDREVLSINEDGEEAAFSRDFYRCPNTGDWVYSWIDERIVGVDSNELRRLRAAHPEPQPVTRQQIVEALNSVFYSDQRPIIPHAADAVLALFASPAPVPLLPTQEAIAEREGVLRSGLAYWQRYRDGVPHVPSRDGAAVTAAIDALTAVLDLLGRTQPEPVRAALICGACGHEWTAHDDSGCARGLCRCDEPCPDPLPPAAGVQEPTPERPEWVRLKRATLGHPADAVLPIKDWYHGLPRVEALNRAALSDGTLPLLLGEWVPAVPPVSAPEPEPAPTSPLAFMDRCPTCDLPAEGAPDGAQVCSDGFHRAAAPELTPDRPTKRPRPVRLFPGQELTVAAPSPGPERRQQVVDTMFQAWQDAPPDRNVWDYVAERVLDITSASPDPEADDGRRQAVIEAAKEWYAAGAGGSSPDGRVHRAHRNLRRAVRALGEDIDG